MVINDKIPGWCFGTMEFYDFPIILGMSYSQHLPTDFHSMIFQRGRSTTNQYISGWWFGTFFIFPYIGNSNPN